MLVTISFAAKEFLKTSHTLNIFNNIYVKLRAKIYFLRNNHKYHLFIFNYATRTAQVGKLYIEALDSRQLE